MPWFESCAVGQRVEFIADWLGDEWSVTELAKRYGVSRKTANKWIARYKTQGPSGLEARSSAPLRHGRATDGAVVADLVALKRARPSWGPIKLIRVLEAREPLRPWPSRSTAAAILAREGLTERRRQRRRPPASCGALTEALRPNHVWATDHKGWVKLGDGTRCEPLTISDSFSRFLIALASCQSTAQAEARPVFERAFAEFGLPDVIRSDNGPPFAAPTLTGLTALTIWWASLGIRHERITPGRPQQNGRHERLHRTLAEAMRPPAPDLTAQNARFEAFHEIYNHERPHEALGLNPPASVYMPSTRRLPDKPPEPDYPSHADVRRVRSNGEIKWGGNKLFLCEALVGRWVAVTEREDGNPIVRYFDTPIAFIDTRQRRTRSLSFLAREERQNDEQTVT